MCVCVCVLWCGCVLCVCVSRGLLCVAGLCLPAWLLAAWAGPSKQAMANGRAGATSSPAPAILGLF
eukprot:COSAG01_NODE_3127_length_6545_cov_1.962612_4_plen_66_part_00